MANSDAMPMDDNANGLNRSMQSLNSGGRIVRSFRNLKARYHPSITQDSSALPAHTKDPGPRRKLTKSAYSKKPFATSTARRKQQDCSLLRKLPLEIRLMIYEYVVGTLESIPLDVGAEAIRGYFEATTTPMSVACEISGPDGQELMRKLFEMQNAIRSARPYEWTCFVTKTSCEALSKTCRQVQEELVMIDRSVDGWRYVHLDLRAGKLSPRRLHQSEQPSNGRLQKAELIPSSQVRRCLRAKKLLLQHADEADRSGCILCWSESAELVQRRKEMWAEERNREAELLDEQTKKTLRDINKAFEKLKCDF